MFMDIKSIYLLLAFILALGIDCKPLKVAKIIKAVNCGLKDGYTRGDGDFKYENDQNLVTGKSVDVDYYSDTSASNTDIMYTVQKEIYMFERHTYNSMTYTLPVKTGKHTLILKFAEMYFEKVGQRVFNIKIGDTIVIQNMDVIEKSGGRYSAHQEFLEFEVKDANVWVNNNKIPNALKAGNIQVTFVKGKADNPIIQGIIVYHGGVEETNKEDYQNLKKNWGSHKEMIKAKKDNEKIKQMISMTKKKERIIIRNDQLLIEQDQSQKEQVPHVSKFGPIRLFLMSPVGILIWTCLFIYAVYFLYSKVFLLSKPSTSEEIKEE